MNLDTNLNALLLKIIERRPLGLFKLKTAALTIELNIEGGTGNKSKLYHDVALLYYMIIAQKTVDRRANEKHILPTISEWRCQRA